MFIFEATPSVASFLLDTLCYNGHLMRRNIYNSIYYCVLGLILIVISSMAIIQREDFLMRVFDVLAWILIINGLHELSVFLRRRFRGDLINIIGNIGVGIFILSYTAIPIRLLFAIFAIYITLFKL